MIFVLLILISDVFCKHQMDWGSNPDLVNEFNPIQGRENYKLMVAMVGETIKLDCEIAFASKPAKKIVWEIDGKPQTTLKTQKEDEDKTSGKMFIDDAFEIVNITKEMDDKRVSCVYDEASVEVILHVFKLDFCATYAGDVELLFRESLRSKTGEDNVDSRIKSKIAEMTHVTSSEVSDINSNSEYSIILPISTAKDIQDIMGMDQEQIYDCQTDCQEQENEIRVQEKANSKQKQVTKEKEKQTREQEKQTSEQEKKTREQETSTMIIDTPLPTQAGNKNELYKIAEKSLKTGEQETSTMIIVIVAAVPFLVLFLVVFFVVKKLPTIRKMMHHQDNHLVEETKIFCEDIEYNSNVVKDASNEKNIIDDTAHIAHNLISWEMQLPIKI